MNVFNNIFIDEIITNNVNSVFIEGENDLDISTNYLQINSQFNINNFSINKIFNETQNIFIDPSNTLIINGNLDMCQNSILNVTKIYNNILEPFNSNTLVINGNLDMCNNSINQVNEINNGLIKFNSNLITNTNTNTKIDGNIEFIGTNKNIENVFLINNNDNITIKPTNKLIVNGNIDMSGNNIINVNQLISNNSNTEKINITNIDESTEIFKPLFVSNILQNTTLFADNKFNYDISSNTLNATNIKSITTNSKPINYISFGLNNDAYKIPNIVYYCGTLTGHHTYNINFNFSEIFDSYQIYANAEPEPLKRVEINKISNTQAELKLFNVITSELEPGTINFVVLHSK
jgi:hypothetical protein